MPPPDADLDGVGGLAVDRQHHSYFTAPDQAPRYDHIDLIQPHEPWGRTGILHLPGHTAEHHAYGPLRATVADACSIER